MQSPFEDETFRSLSDVLIGQVLPGSEGRRYPLRERIGEGAQGWVFRASWNGGVDVVVKVLRPDPTSKEALARFQREAEVLRMLSQQATPNPHVVRFLDHAYATVHVPKTGKSWDLAYTVLELVEGETLEAALERAQPGGLGLERSRRILRHVALALGDVHAHNVVHRDLKPSNILLATPGAREIAKVTDFGLAKRLDPGMQRTSHLAGATVGYAPPEQYENGNLRVGPHTDVFSLAAIFYELVTGRPAFPFRPVDHPLMVVIRILNEARPAFSRVREQLPPELRERPDVIDAVDAEIARAMDPDPGKRHRTVADLRDNIERALDAIGSAPSAMAGSGYGGVVVRGNQVADIWGDRAHSSAPPPAGVTPISRREAWLAITAATSGEAALGVGPQGPHRWDRRGWTRVELPPGVDPASMRAAAWIDDSMVFAGASPVVTAVSPRWAPGVWRFDQPGIVFHGACADRGGILLSGERMTDRGPAGVLVEIPFGDVAPPRLIDVPGVGPLRAVCRSGTEVLACGDGGAFVQVMDRSLPPRVARLCQAPLYALIATPDGARVTVGGGGFALQVSPSLAAKLDAVQTTRDLFTVSLGANGHLFCGGAAGRVLRRDEDRWVRIGGSDGDANVRAIHATWARLLVFLDDGNVVESVAR